ncbi:MAG: hypothetical protein ACI4T5_06915 [Prevotella sp.]
MRKFTLVAIMAMSMLSINMFAITVDDLVGDYEETTTGSECITTGFESWAALSSGYSVTITKTGENTVTINNIQGWGVNFYGTVDLEARTITVQPAKVWDYYDFAILGTDGVAAPTVFNITEEGDLQLDYWALLYNGATYGYGATTLKKANIKAVHDAEYKIGEWMSGFCQVKVIDDYYVIEGLMGTTRKFMFSVADNGELLFAGADFEPSEEYPGYWFYYLTSAVDCMGLYTTDGMSSFTGDEKAGSMTCAFEYYASYNDDEPLVSGDITVTWPTDPNGIKNVKNESATDDNKCYNLSGQIVNPAIYKGIVVKNGKKVRL